MFDFLNVTTQILTHELASYSWHTYIKHTVVYSVCGCLDKSLDQEISSNSNIQLLLFTRETDEN